MKQSQSVSSELVNKEQSSETSESADSQAEKSETESVSVNTPSEPDGYPKIVENIPSPHDLLRDLHLTLELYI